MSVKMISAEAVNALIDQASKSARDRQHLNLHANHSEPCQRLLNAVGIASYIRPHRHALDPKTESLFAVCGLFALVIFDETGKVQQVVKFGSEKYSDSMSDGFGVELAPGTWHTVLALLPDSVLLEVKEGPFDPSLSKEAATWAPEEGTCEAIKYLADLRNMVGGSSTWADVGSG